MLHIVQGDLLDSDCTIIAHQANSFSTMGAGIAKQIKERYPLAYKMDKQFPLPPEERLGKASFAYYPEKPLIIFNLYGQYFYGKGRHTDYNALSNAVYEMFQTIKTMPIEVKHKLPYIKVGLPYLIGSGLAGGNWGKVRNILEYHSNQFGIDIYLYRLN